MTDYIELTHELRMTHCSNGGLHDQAAAAITELQADLAAARAERNRASFASFAYRELWKSADSERDELLKDLAAARALLLDIKNDPHGCRFCDDGVLRVPNNPDKDHDPGCVWPRIEAALAGKVA